MPERIPFSGNPLDRAATLRRDAAWLLDQVSATESRFLPFWRLNVLAREVADPRNEAEQAELRWLDARVGEHLEDGTEPLLLGVRDGTSYYAVDLSALADPIAALRIEDAVFADARR